MKKFTIILLLAILFIPCVLSAAELTDSDIIQIIKDGKANVIGVFNVGFVTWFLANWWFFILSVIGIGAVIIKITPTKRDDLWLEKWILKPLRFVGQVLTLNIPGHLSK